MTIGQLRTAPGSAAARFLAIGAVLLTGLSAGACASGQEHEISLAAPPHSAMALDVVNPRGSVTVTADPKASGITVRSTAALDKDARVQPGGGEYDVNVTAEIVDDGGGRSTLVVRVDAPQGDATPPHRVDIDVTAPRCDGARIVNAGGPVRLDGATGAIQVENTDGSVQVRTPRPLSAPVALITTDGDVYLQAPPGTAGRVELRSLNGGAQFRSDIDRLLDMKVRPDSVVGVLRGGENPIVLQSGDGDVGMWIMNDPLALTRWLR